jgi:hypothetical protein
MRIHATAVLAPDGGRVSADTYTREMNAAEARALAAAAREAIAEATPGPGPRTAARDTFVYQFSIIEDDGAATMVTATDAGPGSPGLQRLVDWARVESSAIGLS